MWPIGGALTGAIIAGLGLQLYFDVDVGPTHRAFKGAFVSAVLIAGALTGFVLGLAISLGRLWARRRRSRRAASS